MVLHRAVLHPAFLEAAHFHGVLGLTPLHHLQLESPYERLNSFLVFQSKVNNLSGVIHTPLVPVLGRQRQVGL